MAKSILPIRTTGLLLTVALLAGCMSVQTTAPGTVGVTRTQRMSPLVSEAELNQGALQAYAQVIGKARQEGAIDNASPVARRVQAIVQRLVQQVPALRPEAAGWQWEVHVIRSDELNAWCMPGGKMAIYTGIIDRLKLTDPEIAAIMGHEIAHALREHARERASEQATATAVIGIGAAVAGLGKPASDLTQLAYQSTFGLRHSRLHESEADRIGVELSARAGYDPRAAISLWQKMQSAQGGKGGMPEFLSTHPAAETRIRDLERDSAIVLPLWQERGGR